MSKNTANDEESFIILGTSPGTSLDVKCNGLPLLESPLRKEDIEDALKALPIEANMAFKAHFKLGDCPSPASMMIASSIVSDDKSTQELQKRFGEILDENLVLKETLKQNNDSMKEQFLLIASCQEDMLNTHKMHKEKFDETRGLIEKLKLENKKLKQDISQLLDGSAPNSNVNGETRELRLSLNKSIQSTDKLNQLTEKLSLSVDKSTPSAGQSGASSTIEFVTSPDDDTVNKLTAQLELVEKQRRQVIVDNEKLTWQKESLESIVDATSKERDELKKKLKSLELHYSSKEEVYVAEINKLKLSINELQKTQTRETSAEQVSTKDLQRRDQTIQQLETKVTTLQNELKNAQLKILELENVKLEFSRQKAGTVELSKVYKDQIQGLNNRLREAQTIVFQPIRFSISSDSDLSMNEYSNFVSNIKLYDRTLKHLSDLLNPMTNGISDSLLDVLGLVTNLHEVKLDRTSMDSIRKGLGELKQMLERQHNTALNNIVQIKGTLSIFEGIFTDHKELLKTTIAKQENQESSQYRPSNVDALTAALVARGKELEDAKEDINGLLSKITVLQQEREDIDLLKAQIEVYKCDFEAERESREKMASEKETMSTDLRTTKKQNQELLQQLSEVRKLNPNIYKSATTPKVPRAPSAGHAAGFANALATASVNAPATAPARTGNMVYTCPKCMRFSSDQYKVMEDHFDYCLEN